MSAGDRPRPASLPMYGMPAIAAARSAWWKTIAERLRAMGFERVPDTLTEPEDNLAHWRDPDLLFSQTCGRPLRHRLENAVRVVATPCYAAPGCNGPRYRSFLLVRTDDPARGAIDLRGRTAAVNGWLSHSGASALRALVGEAAVPGEPFFGDVILSGGHVASIDAVRSESADCAAVDTVTYGLLERHEPDRVRGLRFVAESPDAPALPFVTGSAATDPVLACLRQALDDTMTDPSLADVRDAMLLAGVEPSDETAYAEIDAFEHAVADVKLSADDPGV